MATLFQCKGELFAHLPLVFFFNYEGSSWNLSPGSNSRRKKAEVATRLLIQLLSYFAVHCDSNRKRHHQVSTYNATGVCAARGPERRGSNCRRLQKTSFHDNPSG